MMRCLTEKEMTLVSGGIGLNHKDSTSFTRPSPGLMGGAPTKKESSGGDVKKIVQDACGDKGAKSVTVTKKGSSVGVKVGYTPPKKVTVTPSYNSGSTTVTVDCN